MKVCYLCKRELPLDAFLTITVRDKRCRPGYSWKGLSYDCRQCRKEVRREQRRKKAEAAGKSFLPRGDRAAYEAKLAAARADTKARRRIAWALCLAFWRLIAMSPEERRRKSLARSVVRQRRRYNTDPVYQANVKARKIRRKRALRGTQVVPINRELVAQRDGWRCGICGKLVTRETWSLDHVVPLSKGGAHTYANVVLAHRSCNSRRGAGRLAVQPSLFALPSGRVTGK